MEIRRMLELSTAHLPERFFNKVDESHIEISNVTVEYWGTVVYPTEHGALLWVPDDPRESSEHGQEKPTEPEVLAVQLFAREHGCDYVLFDCDAEKCEGLPVWESGQEAPEPDVTKHHQGTGRDCVDNDKMPDEMCSYCRSVLGYKQKTEDTYPEGSPPYDAATATGMYDEDEG